MVVCDLHIVGSAVMPSETEPPLIIDSDAVSLTVTPQRFQPIARNFSEIGKLTSCIELPELSASNSLDISETRDDFVVIKLLRLPRAKAFNHVRIAYYASRTAAM
jgi:hypothetical protein